MMVSLVGIYSCSDQECDDFIVEMGNDLLSQCPQTEDFAATALVNGSCWSTTQWIFHETDDAVQLEFMAFGGALQSFRDVLSINIPKDNLDARYYELFGVDSDNDQANIEWSVVDYRDSLIAHYSINCSSDLPNQIKASLTDYPVHLIFDFQGHLRLTKQESDLSAPQALIIDNTRFRLPITIIKSPTDNLSLCDMSEDSNVIFNGSCRSVDGTHSFYFGGTQISLVSKPLFYREDIYFDLPIEYQFDTKYPLTSDSDSDFNSRVFISDFDALIETYEISESALLDDSYVIIDSISTDSSHIYGRFQAYYEKNYAYSSFGTYDYIFIKEGSFRTERLQ